MKLSMKTIMQIAGGLLLAVISYNSWAAILCSATPGFPRTDTVQLSPANISAGADIPVGTVIYQGRWLGGDAGASQLSCKSPVDDEFWYNVALTINSAPLPLSTSVDNIFGGAVYQTGISGIGIAISLSNNSNATKIGAPINIYPEDRLRPITGGEYLVRFSNITVYFSLIKTGQIAPGNFVLSASNLPKVSLTAVNTLTHASVPGLPVNVNFIQFQGQLNISTQTCTTPDVNVYLGSYEQSKHFTGINSATSWIDSSIKLTNCPTFSGFYNAANSTLMFDYSTGQGNVATPTSNSIGVRLTPVTSVIDAANGIIGLDTTISGAASGVGIQIGWGAAPPQLFDLSSEKLLTLPADGSGTINVPMVARYIQTSATVTPGKANAKVVFLINYY